jgi:hypothetical protein
VRDTEKAHSIKENLTCTLGDVLGQVHSQSGRSISFDRINETLSPKFSEDSMLPFRAVLKPPSTFARITERQRHVKKKPMKMDSTST